MRKQNYIGKQATHDGCVGAFGPASREVVPLRTDGYTKPWTGTHSPPPV